MTMPNRKLKIYLVAGEPSGDALGARLMRALKKKTDGNVAFFGVGGDSMEKEGLAPLFDISDLAIMGLAEIIPSIPKVLRHIKNTVEDIVRVQPDIVVTIDSWSFASRVQKALRKKKTGIPQVHYVAPQVWAWKKKRAQTMYKYVDHLLTLLPQEPKYFTPYRLPATFVGHPVIESRVTSGDASAFRQKYKIAPEKTARLLKQTDDNFYFVIPTVKTVAKRVKETVRGSGLEVLVVESEEDRHNAFVASEAAIAASGTVALELAIADIPHIVAYRVSPLSALLVRHFLHIQFVNLSNILLGREIIPELLQERCIPANILSYMKNILEHRDWYEKQKEGFKKVRAILGVGEQTPSENAADVILKLAKK